jgi:hypothetical protein
MFDCMALFREMDDFGEVKQTYDRMVEAELMFRELPVGKGDVLKDTIAVCSCIIGRGSVIAEDYGHYQKGLSGIRGHIYKAKYTGEYAALYACEVMYLAASILSDKDDCPRIIHADSSYAAFPFRLWFSLISSRPTGSAQCPSPSISPC